MSYSARELKLGLELVIELKQDSYFKRKIASDGAKDLKP